MLVRDELFYYTAQVNDSPASLGWHLTDGPDPRNIPFLTQDRTKEPRGRFELVKGCVIGNISEIDAPNKQLKKHVRARVAEPANVATWCA